MDLQDDSADATVEYIRAKLRVSKEGRILKVFSGPSLPVTPDLAIVDGDRGYIVEITRRVSLDALSRLNLLKDLLKPEDMGVSELSYHLAGSTIPQSVSSLATALGMQVLPLPATAGIAKLEERKAWTVKVTTEKAWRVTSHLIGERTSSIRALSLKENVSYGWAHATVQGLRRQGIVKQIGNRVIVEDVDKLLNGVAWERPLQTLVKKELRTPFKETYEGAREITTTLNDRGLKFAFAGYIAGTLYTGQSVRHDLIQLYLDSEGAATIEETYGTTGEGILIQILTPDRDIFSDSRILQSVRVTSPSQTLLDLAGMGYAARALAVALVENYGNLRG